MATKLDKVAPCCERLEPLNSHGLTLIRQQIDEITSLLSQDLWTLNLAGCWLQGGGSEVKRLSRHWLFVFFLFSFLPSYRCFWTDWQNLFVNLSSIAALSACDQDKTYEFDMLCAFKPCLIEINSNSKLKRKRMNLAYQPLKIL